MYLTIFLVITCENTPKKLVSVQLQIPLLFSAIRMHSLVS